MPKPEPPKFRHEWYQTPQKVTVEVFARKMPAEAVHVQFAEDSLVVMIDEPNAYTLSVPLFGPVLPEQCKYQVLTSKVRWLGQFPETSTSLIDLLWNSLETIHTILYGASMVPWSTSQGRLLGMKT